MIVKPDLWGNTIRLRLTNVFGARPIALDDVYVGLQSSAGNIAPGTSDDEIRELVRKYAPDLECASIQRVDGDGSRPAAMLEVAGPVEQTVTRLHGMYWKERKLVVQTLRR